MKPQIIPIEVPGDSEINTQLSGANFHDAYKVRVSTGERSALDIYLDIVSQTPSWVDYLMALRNKITSIFGLKDLGLLGDVNSSKTGKDYCVGERVGIFSILSLSEKEVILGDSDKHLDVKVSIYKLNEGNSKFVAVSTVVYIHNALGRIYMLFIVPVHKLIVPATLARIGTANNT